jgi:hypothetical protein
MNPEIPVFRCLWTLSLALLTQKVDAQGESLRPAVAPAMMLADDAGITLTEQVDATYVQPIPKDKDATDNRSSGKGFTSRHTPWRDFAERERLNALQREASELRRANEIPGLSTVLLA